MKNFNLLLCVFLACFVSQAMMAQSSNEEKEMVIITKTIDAEGNEVEEKVVLKGDEVDAYMKESGMKMTEKMNSNGEREIEVEVNMSSDEKGEQKEINIWVDEDGKTHEVEQEHAVFMIEADDIPEDLKKQLKEQGIDVDALIKEKTMPKEMEVYKMIMIDEDGNEKVIEWDGQGEMPKEIQDKMNESDTEVNKKQKVRIVEIDEDGNKKVMDWEDNGAHDMPDEMKKKLEENDIDLDVLKKEGKSKKIKIQIEEDVEMKMDQQGTKTMMIKKKSDNEEKVMKFDLGEGEELPEEVMNMLKENGIDLDDLKSGTLDIEIEEDGTKKKEVKVIKEIHEHHEKSTEKHSPNKAQLGVMIENDPNGVRIIDVVEYGAASLAGLQSGDIITKVDKVSVGDMDSLLKALSTKEVGDKVKISYIRAGKIFTEKVEMKASK